MTEFRIGARFHPGKIQEQADDAGADIATTHFTNLRTIRPQLTNFNTLSTVPVAAHAPYSVNLGHADAFVRRMSFEQLRLNAWLVLDRGGHSVTWHAGTRGSDDWLEWWKPIVDYDWPCRMLIENGANPRGSVATDIDDVERLFDLLVDNPNIGFTLDTAHVYAYLGDRHDRLQYVHDVRKVTEDRIWLIHANGSESEAGSERDQHAPFAESHLPIDEVEDMIRASRCTDIVCESRDPKADISALRRDLGGSASSVASE